MILQSQTNDDIEHMQSVHGHDVAVEAARVEVHCFFGYSQRGGIISCAFFFFLNTCCDGYHDVNASAHSQTKGTRVLGDME